MPETAPGYEAFEPVDNQRLAPHSTVMRIAGGALVLACLAGAESSCGTNDGGGGGSGDGLENCTSDAKELARTQTKNTLGGNSIETKGTITFSACTMDEYKSPVSFRTAKLTGRLAGTRCFVFVKATRKDNTGTHWTIHGLGNKRPNGEILKPFKKADGAYRPDLSRDQIIAAARNSKSATARFAVKKCTEGTGF